MSECDTCGTEMSYEEWKENGKHSGKVFANGVKSVTFCSEECRENYSRRFSDESTEEFQARTA